jgi:hypothetical protein
VRATGELAAAVNAAPARACRFSVTAASPSPSTGSRTLRTITPARSAPKCTMAPDVEARVRVVISVHRLEGRRDDQVATDRLPHGGAKLRNFERANAGNSRILSAG